MENCSAVNRAEGRAVQSVSFEQRQVLAQNGRSPLAEQVLLAFIEMSAGYVSVSGEVTEELNRSAKTNCPRDGQCSRSCADAQTGVGEASGPA
jgi:hypothetical protein